jgi:hypothetical protein
MRTSGFRHSDPPPAPDESNVQMPGRPADPDVPAVVQRSPRAPQRGRRPSHGEMVRLRLRDRPGSLASITATLAGHGVDVLGLEVLDRLAGVAIDDLLLTVPGLEAALAELGPDAEVLARRSGVRLEDRGLAMGAACAALTAAGSRHDTYQRLLSAALGLVFAEAGFVCTRDGSGVLRPVAATVTGLPALDEQAASLVSSALWSGECLTADGRAPWVEASYRHLLPPGTVALVPGGEPPFLLLALVREDQAPFVQAELDRLAALVDVAVGVLSLHRAIERRERVSGEATSPAGFG